MDPKQSTLQINQCRLNRLLVLLVLLVMLVPVIR
jgi:hypothetical protein